MSYNILCSCENDIWFLKAVRRIASIFACVLLKVFHKITQRFTIIVQFISFNLHFFATSINTLYKHFCFRPKLTLDAAALIPPRSLLILIFTPYLCIYINRYIYIYPSALHDAMHEHTSAAGSIACLYLQSSDRLIIRNILLHYFITLAFIVQQLHIEARYIARFNAFALRFISCKFRKNTFLYAIISTTVYDPNLFFKSQKYLSHLLVRQL